MSYVRPRLSVFGVAGRGRPALHQKLRQSIASCAQQFSPPLTMPIIRTSVVYPESAANLRTSWVSSVRWELASKLHLQDKVLDPVEAVCDPIWF
jgi:hypothetical protein